MKILFSGGGTIGSVSPLLAVFQKLKENPDLQFVWVGTGTGPEKALIASYGIPFFTICSGKLRRYFSLQNLLDPILVLIGFLQSIFLLIKHRPSVVVSAGGYVSVPVSFAAFLFGIPGIIHQQDARPGLANRLMAPFSKKITVTFAFSKDFFPAKKTEVIGNPVRPDIAFFDKNQAYKYFNFNQEVSTIMIIGGGTGSSFINELVIKSLPELIKFCQIIHLTGRGKSQHQAKHQRYRPYDFLAEEIKYGYCVADLIICRAGMSTLTEAAFLQKPAVILPLPDSHQVDNAMVFAKNNAAEILDQKNLNSQKFAQKIKEVIFDKPNLINMQRNAAKLIPPTAADLLADIILKYAKK